MLSSLSDSGRRVAVTGATGFIGRHLVARLAESGADVRVLMRRSPAESPWPQFRPQVIRGGLGDAGALKDLLRDVDAVVHLGGLIKARSRAEYLAVNRDGTAALAHMLQQVAPNAHFLQVSSLAAREPTLSDYAASKAAGEAAAREVLGSRLTVLRPSAVYGPGDRETLVFFQLAARRLVPVPAPVDARAAVIHVGDLVRLIERLLSTAQTGAVWSAADMRPEGYTWAEILLTAAAAVGNARPRLLQVPAVLLRTIAIPGDVASRFGNANLMTSQKLRELRHPDWGVRELEWARPDGWSPRFSLVEGFADAVRWYRAAGWLPQGEAPGR